MSAAARILEAVTSRSLQTLRALLEGDPALSRVRDPRGVSVLLLARYHQAFDVLEALLEHRGEDLDVFESAALGRIPRLTRLVAEDPRSIESFSADGFTPLQLATFFAEPAAAKLLLARGADVEVVSRNPMQLRAIHSAAAGGSTEIVERVLLAGAEANARQRGGYTALHAAAHAGRLDMVNVLLANGADPATRTEEGQTARDLAHARGHAAVVQRLEDTSPGHARGP